jgi:DNA-binding response OmpR family regulator
MPAQIVLVHDDAVFAGEARRALMQEGYDVMVFPDPLVALDTLETAVHLELLITRVGFSAGRSNGASLALMARYKRPGVKILLLCRPEFMTEVEDLGEVLAAPVTVSEVVAAAARLMPAAPPLHSGV